MGMGEPLDNPEEVFKALKILNASWGMAFGASNITLSTIGLLPNMESLVESRLCNLAISLHSPFAAQRHELMPVEREYPIEKVVDFFRKNPINKPLRLSFEYIVIPGENDSLGHASATAALLKGLNCHVNVIPLNTARENPQNLLAAKRYQRMLNDLNQPTTLRVSRGIDIDAACGMMAGMGLKK
jgi:23S rRNA (adenine2503-C2)-methyltransferase